MNPISLYLHIPFCVKKCGYCDFLSFEYQPHEIEKYVSYLIKEIKLYGNEIHRPVRSIFFGGGTPSLLSGQMMVDIMNQIKGSFEILPDAEISMEMNPGTVDRDTLKAYQSAGINRISLGVQTLEDNLLKVLDRIHDVQEVKESVKLIHEVGIRNFNLDLMFGLPGQTLENLSHTVAEMIRLGPTHISAYSLKFEEGTPFFESLKKGELTEVEDEIDREMYHYIETKLFEEGFLQYEISNFALPGKACQHNLVYWEKEDYLGIGLGSHGYHLNKRYHNAETFEAYFALIDKNMLPIVFQEEIDGDEDIFEYIILNLRLNKGLGLEKFFIKYGFQFIDQYKAIVDSLLKEGLLKLENDYVALTSRGRDLSNQVFINFL
ncbi:MAG: radical SAM family heme chaperone HemW [Clostridia bacterium]|nr:radical SAM family heme chaperone HemW [Clostridia bacterium]